MREAHDRLENIRSRADSAREGVQSLRRQQQAQGLDMRGDILATMNRLNNDMKEAQIALSAGDLPSANEYIDHADHETASLERFLGR
jgi:serine/threonine-protein kinase